MTKHKNVPVKKETGSLLSLGKLQREIDHLFHSFQSDFKFPDLFGETGDSQFLPTVDVHETENEIRISAELPGVEEKDINVEMQDDVLTISGEKKSETEKKDGDYYRSERSYGSFSRSMSLPAGITEKAIDASFENGVLTVTVAKPAKTERKIKKVPISKANK